MHGRGSKANKRLVHLPLCASAVQLLEAAEGNALFNTFTVHSKVGKMAAFTGTARTRVVETPRKKRLAPGTPPPAVLYTCRKHAVMLLVFGSIGSAAAFGVGTRGCAEGGGTHVNACNGNGGGILVVTDNVLCKGKLTRED